MPNAFDLTGKVALVTGGTRGIGFAMAEALVTAGANVVIWGSDEARAGTAADRLKGRGGQVHGQAVDVADEAAVVTGMINSIAVFGRLDAVFANAGLAGQSIAFLDSRGEELEAILAVNTAGAYFTLREACRHMVARAEAGDRGGSLVAVGSVGTERGMPRFQPYAASKGALQPLIRSIVAEHSKHGIRANLIQPGFVETDMTDHFRASANVNEAILRRVPQRRWGRPADFGGIAVYLASDASAFHSGDTLVIDGGYLVS